MNGIPGRSGQSLGRSPTNSGQSSSNTEDEIILRGHVITKIGNEFAYASASRMIHTFAREFYKARCNLTMNTLIGLNSKVKPLYDCAFCDGRYALHV